MTRARLATLAAAVAVGVAAGGCTPADPTGSAPGAAPTTADEATPVVVEHGATPPPLHPSVDGYPAGTVELVVGDGTIHRLPVRVAGTQEQRGHGLMEVPDVPAGTGMAFTYDEDRDGAYTMRGTRTPLQIAWVDADGRVVRLRDMVPCRAEPCPRYEPDATYRLALEVRAGWFDEVGLGLGDTVRLVAP